MKRLLSLFLAAALVLTLAACGGEETAVETTLPQGTVPSYDYTIRDIPEAKYLTPASDFAGGTGTEEDPYQIADAAQLALISEKLKEGGDYVTAHYVLTADITLNDTEDFASWGETAPEYQWLPIGTGASRDFSGVLDGDGYTIHGLYINTNCESYTENAYGIFASLQGTVKDLNLSEAYLEISGYGAKVGGVAGYLRNREGLIENCTVNANIFCYDGAYGGIVGSLVDGNRIGGEAVFDPENAPTVTGCVFEGALTQYKADSLSYLGGIAGESSGFITDCVNRGTLSFGAADVDAAGGIVARANSGRISDCRNPGDLICAPAETGLARVGGIAGMLFLSSTGSADYMSRGVSVVDCENTGAVGGGLYAGGIVGSANNAENDWCLTVFGCYNTGAVTGADYVGGIVGYLATSGHNDNGDNVVISRCTNASDLSAQVVGGIVGQFYSRCGDVRIDNCRNTGNLTASGQHCGGIIAMWTMHSDPEKGHFTLSDCVNQGGVQSALCAGGIVSAMDLPVCLSLGGDLAITLTDCSNSGPITVSGINGYVGGILGAWGMENIPTRMEDCTNSGDISITHVLSNGTLEEEKVMTISRIAGGLIGRVGAGLLLTTDNDAGSPENIQKEGAVLVLRECEQSGSLTLADDTQSEVFQNYLGGIVGCASGEDGYSIYVEDCRYAGFDRGLGNEEFPDLGEKK